MRTVQIILESSGNILILYVYHCMTKIGHSELDCGCSNDSVPGIENKNPQPIYDLLTIAITDVGFVLTVGF